MKKSSPGMYGLTTVLFAVIAIVLFLSVTHDRRVLALAWFVLVIVQSFRWGQAVEIAKREKEKTE